MIIESLLGHEYINGSRLSIEKGGTRNWRNKTGQLHRKDGPAVECKNGTKLWYINDCLHREDGPAQELSIGTKGWWLNGKAHREDGPAVEFSNGDKLWYLNGRAVTEEEVKSGNYCDSIPGEDPVGNKWWKNRDGKLHRIDGPASINASGDKFWSIKGKHHREDGPAIEYVNGDKSWFINGELHRTDGPAIECVGGYKQWWLNGKEVTEEEVMSDSVMTVGTVGTGSKWWKNKQGFHRVDGPAIEYRNGDKAWYLNGFLHRKDGPAIDYTSGEKAWYMNGVLHREDGPAQEFTGGRGKWWLDGKQVTEEVALKFCVTKMIRIDGLQI